MYSVCPYITLLRICCLFFSISSMYSFFTRNVWMLRSLFSTYLLNFAPQHWYISAIHFAQSHRLCRSLISDILLLFLLLPFPFPLFSTHTFGGPLFVVCVSYSLGKGYFSQYDWFVFSYWVTHWSHYSYSWIGLRMFKFIFSCWSLFRTFFARCALDCTGFPPCLLRAFFHYYWILVILCIIAWFRSYFPAIPSSFIVPHMFSYFQNRLYLAP